MQNYKGCWLHFNKSYIFDVFLCLLLSVYYSLIQNKQVHTEELNIKSAGQYYLDGLYNYTDRSYTTAAEQFEALSKNHPHSSYTKNSLIMELQMFSSVYFLTTNIRHTCITCWLCRIMH